MAIAIGDVVRFTVFQAPGVNEVLNVFHYQTTEAISDPTDYEAMGRNFWDHVKAAWRAFVATDYNPWFDRIVIENLTNGLDFGVYTITGAERAGTRSASGDFLGQWICAAVRMNVGSRLTRPGQKRFSPLYEGDQANGLLTSGMVTILTALGAVLDDHIDIGSAGDGDARPIIYGEVNPNRIAVVENPIVSATVIQMTTTQRTRRR